LRAFIVSSVIVPLLLAASLSAKGATTKVTVRDVRLQTSIDITDPAVLEGFNVWAGAGTFVNGVEGTEGFIIDWSSGARVARRPGLARYEVRFYVGRLNSAGEQPTYVVFYEHDPSSGLGFVYLPGKSDPQYPLNTRAIFRGHGFEGRWFRATAAWQNAVGTFIRRARLSAGASVHGPK
jgi:hypothetical protein